MTSRSSSAPLRVMLVEDHAFVRTAIRNAISVPGVEVVAEAPDAETCLALVVEQRPDVILIDVDLPGMSGVQLVRELAPRLPDSHLVMLTASADKADLVAAVRNGAAGYLTKDMSGSDLANAILGIRRGELPMPSRLAAELVRQLVRRPAPPDGNELSEREQDVLRLISDGLTDREIGDALGISPRTVGRHVGNILAKLGVRNRVAAARRYREGL
ncbi:MAG TPA: response regulator transcription factor [Candidatus Limnocylindrales bacterium]|jgi:DNA-binding NarL/FixJ family response regulator